MLTVIDETVKRNQNLIKFVVHKLSVAVSTAGINYWPHLGLSTVPQHQLMFPTWRGCRAEPGIKHSFLYLPQRVCLYWSLSLWPDICPGDSMNKSTAAERVHPFADSTGLSPCDPPGWDQLGDERRASAALHLFPLPLPSVTQQGVVSDFRGALDGLVYKADFIAPAEWLSKRKASGLQNVKTFGCIL